MKRVLVAGLLALLTASTATASTLAVPADADPLDATLVPVLPPTDDPAVPACAPSVWCATVSFSGVCSGSRCTYTVRGGHWGPYVHGRLVVPGQPEATCSGAIGPSTCISGPITFQFTRGSCVTVYSYSSAGPSGVGVVAGREFC